MSTELIKARTQLAKVGTYLKQSKILPAVMSLNDALSSMMRNPLMKQERDEFQALMEDAVLKLSIDSNFKKISPIALTYEPGNEKALLDLVQTLMGELHEEAVDEAKEMLRAVEQHRADQLEKGQDHLDKQEVDKAVKVFDNLVKTYNEDTDLKADIAERFIKAGHYAEALDYLEKALEEFPESIHLINRMGIVLRKMGKFEEAETYYKKAVEYSGDDPGLYFNFGRLYIDWKKWDKVEETAQKALEISPDFTEAKKMLTFARKKMA